MVAYIKAGISTTIAALVFVLSSSGVFSIGPTPVELIVPDTTVVVSGKAAPNALVTVSRNDVIIGTVAAGTNGVYSRLFGAQNPGIQNYKIYYTDSDNNRSRINSQSVSVQPQQQTNIIANLSPTITRRTPSQVAKGSIIQINGYTAPDSEVTLKFSSKNITFKTNSNQSGFYEFLIDSGDLNEGNYIASVSSISNGIDLSDTSSVIVFDITSGIEPSTPDIVVRPDQLPPPVPLSPDTGTTIAGDTVEISGQSIPNAQINIYENGILYSSVFSDSNGNWSFNYTASSSPVTFSFEACVDGRCSVLSKTLTLSFTSTGILDCSLDFELASYRFWGVEKDAEIVLELKNVTNSGVFEVVWGDNVIEYFDYTKDSSNDEIVYAYNKSGNYNGKITLKESRNDECGKTRYFSSSIEDRGTSGVSNEIMWVLILISGLLTLNYISRKDKQNTIQN